MSPPRLVEAWCSGEAVIAWSVAPEAREEKPGGRRLALLPAVLVRYGQPVLLSVEEPDDGEHAPVVVG
jgi:hypothetical protein